MKLLDKQTNRKPARSKRGKEGRRDQPLVLPEEFARELSLQIECRIG
jgi:hypothetical protein